MLAFGYVKRMLHRLLVDGASIHANYYRLIIV